ncbi:MAG: TonB-dependent receptor [Prevotellaceae bacterium]|jgi:outer membrane receptor protein involved in Fe transport|nr:TonB-dependent receptor [Prevotellaceae bacterium]
MLNTLLRIIYIYIFVFACLHQLAAQSDTTSVNRNQPQDLDEVVVISFKDGGRLTKLPAAVSIISEKEIERRRINGIRDLSVAVPNLFIPDYGSKYTSAVYIRGIGSRLGNSAIGMYVDGMPYLDKTSFDFEMFDIKRIEVLRGPQGTLYGRNSMGGLLNIYTLSPFDFQGGKFKVSAGSYGRLQTQIAQYVKLSERLAFSIAGNYQASDGFVKNRTQNPDNKYSNAASIFYPGQYDKNTVGASQTAVVRGGLEWKANDRLSFSYNASFDYSDQNGYAYRRYNHQTNLPDTVSYDGIDYYRRNMFNTGLKIKYAGAGFDLISTTGYQWFKDSLLLDQDFSPRQVFTLNQNQTSSSITQEITLRSAGTGNFKWLGGVAGFYQNLDLTSLVTFGPAGVKMIQDTVNALAPITLTFTDSHIPVFGTYNMKNYGASAFLQTGYENLFIEGLTLSAGLRFDYEKALLEHFTHGKFHFILNNSGPIREKPDSIPKGLYPGKEKMDVIQLLPKFSLQYQKKGQMIYAAVSRGYKTGGYNLQMFSDLMQEQMKSMAPINFNIQEAVSYRPEYSWNYEIGGRFSLDGENRSKLVAGLTIFYLDIRDQQIAQWAPGGQGRMIKNAGQSASKGIEFDATYYPVEQLRIGLAYGYTQNKFTDYTEAQKIGSDLDYKGYYVPFVPRNTVSVNVAYSLNIRSCLIDRLIFDAQYSGAGKIYWTEANDVSQKFYSLVNAKITAEKSDVSLSLWGRNLTSTEYATFYFKTFGNSFGQLGRPLQLGLDLTIKF